jgi:hypothetical protein
VRDRVRDVRPALWPIAQTALAAGASWELARHVAHHPRPIFAPIVAIVAMGIKAGRRARAALFMVLGVTLGIAVADVVVRGLGSGGLQIVVVVAIAMTVAAAIRAEPLFVSQAGTSGMLVVVLPATAGARLGDCFIGGGVAFVASALLFPLDTERAFQREVARVAHGIADALDETAAALELGDPERAWAARSLVFSAQALDEALSVERGAARVAPRRAGVPLDAHEHAVEDLAGASRATRVLGGAAARLLRAGTAPELAVPLRLLAAAAREAPEAVAGSGEARTRVAERAAAATAGAQAVARAPDDVRAATLVHLVETIGDRLVSASR